MMVWKSGRIKAYYETKKRMRIVDGRNISAEDYPEKETAIPNYINI